MADKVSPSPGHRGDPIEANFGTQYGGGNSTWLPSGSDTPTILSSDDPDITETNLNTFSQTSSGTSLDVTIDAGEGYHAGGWFVRDTSTTVTLASSTNNQSVFVGYSISAGDTVKVGLSGAFNANDPKTEIHQFDTDGSGVTSSTDLRQTSKTANPESFRGADVGTAASSQVIVGQGNGDFAMQNRFNSVDVFNADGTFDSSSVDLAFVEVVGAGGGGGATSGSSGETQLGGGGAGGGYAAGYVNLSNTSSVSITVGSGGSGGATGSDGGSGGNSSFGTLIEASGGSGGNGTDSTTARASGGTGDTGEITINGNDGGQNRTDTNIVEVVQQNGGANSFYGSGATPDVIIGASSGANATQPGGGGAGGVSIDTSVDSGGGDGADGVVIVRY